MFIMKEKIVHILKKVKQLKYMLSPILKKTLRFKYMLVPFTILLVLPPVCTCILGYEFSAHSVSKVPTVIVNHDDTSTTQGLVNQIKTNDKFNVVEYSQNDNDVKSLIDRGKAAVGIIIPANFSKDLTDGKAPKIMVFYDGAQTSVAGAGKSKIAEILGAIKAGYLIGIGEGKLGMMPEVVANNINPIRYTSRVIGNPTSNMTNFFLQGTLLNMVQISMAITAILVIKKGNSYKVIWIKGIIVALIGSISSFLVIGILYKYFGFPYRGSVKAVVVLTIIYDIGITFFGVLQSISKNGDKVEAISSCGIIASTMMFAGYTYPVIAMPNIFSIITKYTPFSYYAIPLRDLSLVGGTFKDILPDISWLAKFMIIMWIVTFLKYISNKRPKKPKKARKGKKIRKDEIANTDEVEVITG